MLTRSLPADTVKPCIKIVRLDEKLKFDSKIDYTGCPRKSVGAGLQILLRSIMAYLKENNFDLK
jgi:hypothetical protein